MKAITTNSFLRNCIAFSLFIFSFYVVNAQTYTTIANGNWNSAATWQGGTIPPNINPLPAGATVNIRHTVNFNIGGNIGNNGTIRIQPIAGSTARLNVPTGTNVENYATGKFYIIDASYVQFRFVPGNDGQPYSGNTPGAALQSGTFKNIGGYIECRNFFAEIAQDWTNESNGVRVYENGCIYTGQNFGLSGSSSIDTLIGVTLSIGWHASGNFSLSDGKAYYQGLRVQLAGTSGSFQLSSGTVWGDIDYIMLRNHVVPFNGGGLIEASSSINVDDPATPGTVNLNLDAYHAATFIPNGKFIGTRTSTWPSSPLAYFPGSCPAGGAVPVINIDLSLTKTVNNTACYNNGDTRIFTLTATNTSTTHTATDVTVNDLLPAGFTFVSSAGDGTYVSGTGVWTIGNIFAGGVKTRTITTTVTGTVDRTNTASFGTLQQTDPVLTNNTSSVTLSACVSSYTISGNVFNDVDGLTDGNVDGTGTNNGGALYVSLVNSSNVVIATVPVSATGTYTFPTVVPGNYTVVLHTTSGGSNIAALPAGWVNTGEDCCDNAGSDGTVNGIVPVTVAAANVTNANFGIEQPPTANTTTLGSQANPGGTNSVLVPANSFGGTDASGGIISAIRITAFPSNATSITINGVTYTTLAAITTAYPNGIPTNAAGEPTVPVNVDPVDGNVTVTISYKTIDNAGIESANTGAVNIPFTPISIAGNVRNDVDGLTDGNVDGTGTNAGGTLYVSLVNSSNVVVATVPVNADGTYLFSSVTPGNYTVVLHTTSGGSNISAVPTGWVNTGEDCCDNTGSDGTVNGIVSVSVTTANITNANFGIEQLPNSGVNTQPAQPNPGGTTQITVPASAFSGTDPDGGTISSIRITAFPSDVTSIVINGTSYTSATFPPAGVTVPTNASGQPLQTITIDPLGSGIGVDRTVVIPYVTIDNAGFEDATPGSVTLPFDANAWSVNGNVLNDIDGLTDGNVDGAGVGLPSGTQLYAYLRTSASATILQAVPVNPDGTYAFTEVINGTYTVVISTTQVAVGGTTPAVVLPTNWILTGEDCCDNTGSDGTVNGTTNFTMASANINNVNFGIEQLPTSDMTTEPTQSNPGGTISVSVPATSFGGTDPDGGIITAIRLTAFPTNATSITINSVVYTTLAAIQTAYPNGIPTNAAGEPTVPISIDPVDGNVSVAISYKAIDNAGAESNNTGSVTLPFFIPYNISGTIFNDVDGLTDGNVDGTGTNVGGTLYVSLVDGGNNVIATVPVNADGTYTFTGVNNGSYSVVLHTSAGGSNTAALPAGWVNTGEDCCDNTGSDGTVNGIVSVTVAGADITNSNFGIEQPPVANTTTLTIQPNPGGTTSVPVPANSFGGTDASGGIITAIRITAFPSNATSIIINGVTYTTLVAIQAAYPNGIPTNAAGEPTVPVSVDPADGSITVSIPYKTIDNAGIESSNTGAVNIPFVTVNIFGNVFNDVDGLTDVNVDGAGTNIAGTLFVSLVDGGNNVVATVPVNNDGTYFFTGISNGNYTAVLHTTAAGSNSPALPAGWVNTGEDCCDNAGSDGTVNGTLAVTVTAITVINANFGIEQPPTANTVFLPAQINPLGTISVPVSSVDFGGTDASGGIITAIRITAFPSNATSITIDGVTYTTLAAITTAYPNGIPTNAAGEPTVPVAVDPVDGNVTVSIPYKTIDNAGIESTNTGAANVPFTNLPPVTNNIYNQPVNNSAGSTPIYSLSGSDIDGTVSNYTIQTIPTAAQGVLYLCNPACAPVIVSQVIASADINKLQFDPAATFTGNVTFNYSAIDNSGNTSNTSVVSIPVFNTQPTAQNILTSSMNNTLGSSPIPAINGSDPDGTVVSYTITTIPAPAQGVLYLCNPACAAVTTGQVIALADIAKLQFDPAVGFTGNANFNYTSTDNNGNTSTAATYTIPVNGGTAGNLPPVSNNIIAPVMSSAAGSTAIPGLESYDIDGTIASYTIKTLPPPASGVLYLCNPACAAVTVGQSLTPAQMAQLQFDPAQGFTGNAIFTYSGTDNSTNESNTATYTIPVLNNPPVADPITAQPILNTNGQTAIPPISGSDRDGTVVSYTVTTIPPPAEGVLYLCNPVCNPVTAGQIVALADIAKLQFDPASGFTGNSIFNYTATDNNGFISATAPYTIPVVATNYITGLPPVANNIIAPAMPGTNGSTAIPSLVSTDPDGTIAVYAIESIPPASEGVLYLCNPVCTPVAAGQLISPSEIALLQFDPAAGFNGNAQFDYSTTDNNGNLSNLATYTIPVTALPPVANAILNATIPASAGPTAILPLSGTDPDGSVINYTITSLPPAASGILYLCTPGCTPVVLGQSLTPAQMAQLQFDPSAGWTSPFTGFTYTATDNNGNISNTANYTIPIVSFTTLPVTGLYVSAKLNGAAAIIDWKTESESNTDYFVVERSIDNVNFTKVGTVSAAGNSSTRSNYSLTDDISAVTQTVVYYRILQVDLDGKSVLSNIVTVRKNLNIKISAYPNPFVSDVMVTIYSQLSGAIEMRLTDVSGRTVLQQKNLLSRGTNQFTVNNLAKLPAGTYLLEVTNKADNSLTTIKLIKQ